MPAAHKKEYAVHPNGTVLYFAHKLGEGTFGVATAVTDRNHRTYCLKEVTLGKHAEERDRVAALREVKMMKETRGHPNIIEYHHFWWSTRSKMCILMEYAPNGSLDRFIRAYATEEKRFPTTKVGHYTQELAAALDHCHSQVKIMHRDIKPENILVDAIGTLKLSDFGLSKSLDKGLCQTTCGTPYYMAPEICSGDEYSFPADMWALGCVVYELMALRPPYTGTHQVLLMRKICSEDADYSELYSFYPTHLVDTARWMLQRNPKRRATSVQLVQLLAPRSPPELLDKTLPTLQAPQMVDEAVENPLPPPLPPPPPMVQKLSPICKALPTDETYSDAKKASVAVLQKAVRTSLNRRRRPSPKVGPTGKPSPLGAARLEMLAMPRRPLPLKPVVLGLPVVAPPPPHGHKVRPAWV